MELAILCDCDVQVFVHGARVDAAKPPCGPSTYFASERCSPSSLARPEQACRKAPARKEHARAHPDRASQLHVVAATAAPSHPELGDTKIIFEMADELQVRIPP